MYYGGSDRCYPESEVKFIEHTNFPPKNCYRPESGECHTERSADPIQINGHGDLDMQFALVNHVSKPRCPGLHLAKFPKLSSPLDMTTKMFKYI